MSDVDPIEAIRQYLLADPAVAALVSDRVYGGEVPPDNDVQRAMPQPCVILSPAGGTGLSDGFGDYGAGRVDTICHGSTLNEAWDVYLAVKHSLRLLSRRVSSGVLLHSASLLMKGVLARDPETQWPTTLASWRVLSSDVAAA